MHSRFQGASHYYSSKSDVPLIVPQATVGVTVGDQIRFTAPRPLPFTCFSISRLSLAGTITRENAFSRSRALVQEVEKLELFGPALLTSKL